MIAAMTHIPLGDIGSYVAMLVSTVGDIEIETGTVDP